MKNKYKKRQRWLSYIIIGFAGLITSCKSKSPVREISDHGFTMQVKKMGKEAGDSSLNYAVRLIPAKTMIADGNNELKTKLIYGMDSSFYLQSGKLKIYASLVQPVANGVPGTFEYLVSFDAIADNSNRDLVYHDKYLNHKDYRFNLSDSN